MGHPTSRLTDGFHLLNLAQLLLQGFAGRDILYDDNGSFGNVPSVQI